MNDILCLSHLRWDFVYQRPNHLMARAAQQQRVFYVEEPVFHPIEVACLDVVDRQGVQVVTPLLPLASRETPASDLRWLLSRLIEDEGIDDPVLWYYTPMALPWSDHLSRSLTVYDCMDHLAGFLGAPSELVHLEGALLRRADVVFTGGAQLFEAKRDAHPNVHCFPSSVDVDHFARGRQAQADPFQQAEIPRPRLGYCGVIDERLDLTLIADVAARRPDWQVVMLGPVVKIDPASLPQADNIHYLGMQSYDDLPRYLAGWDIGIMPFAHNDATRFISPTKTPEYLAAGLAVVSTSIRDVVDPYALQDLAHIGDEPDGFIAGCERALSTDPQRRRGEADAFLATMSWDRTWQAMQDVMIASVPSRASAAALGDHQLAGALVGVGSE
jgi:UDP-galactopyranose mutase